MSILINGMEMPRSCNECSMSVDGYCTVVKYPNGDAMNRHYKPLWCPLIEIPPHGRLIDADALNQTIDEVECYSRDPYIGYMSGCIDNAPTIIEAEGRE